MSSSSSSSQTNGVHFFRFIQERNLGDGELKVPTSFMKRYWEGVSNPVTLRLPNKTEWKVNWKKEDGDIWFYNNGWKEFAEHVPLSVSQFMVFHYEGNSCFNVIVLATNGLEIKYPSTIIIDTPIPTAEEKQESDDESDYSLKILDEQSSQPHKKRKTNPNEKKESNLSKPKSSQHHHKKKKTRNGKKKVEAHSSGFDNAAAKHLNSGSSSNDLKKRIKAFHASVKKDFVSNKDFFTCAIRNSYIQRDLLIIPNEFSRIHLRKMVGRSATLFVDDQDTTWNVKLKLYNDYQISFGDGWKKFSIDNNLNTGDVCAFVLTKIKGLSFQVVNHPFKKHTSSPQSQDQEELLSRPSSSSRSLHRKPNSPKVMRNNCMSKKEFIFPIKKNPYHMTIPIKYIKNFISESGEVVTLRVGENSWPVKVLLYESYSLAKFSRGWTKFTQDCQLKEGDICCFKMVDEEKLEFEVTIS